MHFQTITSLELRYDDVYDIDMQFICHTLETNQITSTLKLYSNKIPKPLLQQLMDALQYNTVRLLH
jgi:hypothetical protein